MNSFRSLLALSLAFLATSTKADHHAVRVGAFTNYQHGISGEVYALDENKLFVQDFSYDGAGPDAFFWVGTSAKPSDVGTILPHPFNGKFYDYEDGNAPILEGRFDKQNITLTLPPGQKVSELKWISVWCRAFKVNFGDLFFPADLEIESHAEPESEAESEPESEAEAESEPEGYDHGDAEPESELPPPLLPPHNAHDPHHRHHGDDADAESEAESESESEPASEPKSEPGSSVRIGASVEILVGIAAIMLVR